MLNLSFSKTTLNRSLQSNSLFSLNPLSPLRQWLNKVDMRNLAQAHLICRLIPAQCPFEREVRIGRLVHINVPPLCKLNPLYEEVVGLRFRALCYLAEECAVDICRYC
ncbi:Mo-dependent nitrogenase C-terminal domain-containing protein [Sphaerothrix gracilis]|uniref:Mo-dependent nitrogenase C-terminal domain-containing protein n=1 Tax=Sphaerothrix gracilis TaxID=3151835 RepID=UPI0031FDD292